MLTIHVTRRHVKQMKSQRCIQREEHGTDKGNGVGFEISLYTLLSATAYFHEYDLFPLFGCTLNLASPDFFIPVSRFSGSLNGLKPLPLCSPRPTYGPPTLPPPPSPSPSASTSLVVSISYFIVFPFFSF